MPATWCEGSGSSASRATTDSVNKICIRCRHMLLVCNEAQDRFASTESFRMQQVSRMVVYQVCCINSQKAHPDSAEQLPVQWQAGPLWRPRSVIHPG